MDLPDSLLTITRSIGVPQELRQLAREVRWAGSAVVCPCCEWRGRAFRPSCHDRPGVPWLCARCMSGPDDRALTLVLRAITPSLPTSARVLDVEPSPYTRRWFDRFNQFDYRTLGRPGSGAEIEGDLATVKLTRGICHLIVCSKGIGAADDLGASMRGLHDLTGDDGMVAVVDVRGPSGNERTTSLQSALERAGFAVRSNNLADRAAPADRQRFGLYDSRPILLGVPQRAKRAAAARGHGHPHH